MKNNQYAKTFLLVTLFLVLGFLVGKVYEGYLLPMKQLFYVKLDLYETSDQQLLEDFAAAEKVDLGWSELLPNEEREALDGYKEPTEEEFIQQITDAIVAANDRSYQPPPPSVEVVEAVLGRAVTISGFIVPVEVSEDQRIESYFLVPYFGACIHYPPPPPNQMIYVELTEGFSELNLEQAYTVSGFLEKGLFEDPMGTSAYVLNVTHIKAYYGNPDDARDHSTN